MFRRDVFDQYERALFPAVTERTVARHLAAGQADLVHLGHELMLNLAALTAGIDRPKGTVEETARLGEYNAKFIQGATLAHSTGDKDAQRVVIARALEDWDAEFLAPSVERRRAPSADRASTSALLGRLRMETCPSMRVLPTRNAAMASSRRVVTALCPTSSSTSPGENPPPPPVMRTTSSTESSTGISRRRRHSFMRQ